MATPNTAARNARALDFAADYSSGILEIRSGTVVLASHTMTGFSMPVAGTAIANPIDTEIIVNTGVADNAILSAGAEHYTLSVSTSGADLNLSTVDFVAGGRSAINSFAINF